MKRANDMEQIFFKGIGGSLVLRTGFGIVKDALFAGAGRADIAAGIAANAARKLTAPECKALLGTHGLETFDLGEAVGALFLALFTQKLVKADNLLALADRTFFQQNICAVQRFLAVERPESERFALFFDAGHAGNALGLDLFHVAHALARYTHGVHALACDAVLLEKLHEGIGITGWNAEDASNITADKAKVTTCNRIWKNLVYDMNNFTVTMTVTGSNTSACYIKSMGQRFELDGRNASREQLAVRLGGKFVEWLDLPGFVANVKMTRTGGGDIKIEVYDRDNALKGTYTMTPSEDNYNFELGLIAGKISFNNILVESGRKSLYTTPFTKLAVAGDIAAEQWASLLHADVTTYQNKALDKAVLTDLSKLSDENADLVVIATGLEALLSGKSAAAFETELRAQLTAAKAALPENGLMIVCGLPYVRDYVLGDVTLETYAAYQAVIFKLSEELELPFADLYNAMGERDWTVAEDGRTPTATGNMLRAGEVLERAMREASALSALHIRDLSDAVYPAPKTAQAVEDFKNASTQAAMEAALENDALGIRLDLYRSLPGAAREKVRAALLTADRSKVATYTDVYRIVLTETMRVGRAGARKDYSAKEIKTYVAVGDSISYGAEAVNREQMAWVPVFAKMLNDLSDHEITLINKAIGGTRMCTRSYNNAYPPAKETVQDYIVPNNPDLLTIAYGSSSAPITPISTRSSPPARRP